MHTVTRIPRPLFTRTVLHLLVAGALLATGILGCSDDESMQGPTRTVFGSGTIDEETRTLSGFHGISHQSIGKILVTLGAEEGLRIETDDNLLSEILTEVRNGVLVIRTRENVNIRPTDSVTFYLNAISLREFSISGAGGIEAPGLAVPSLGLTISGVGNLVLTDVDAQTVDLSISGVGDVLLSGTAPTLDIAVAGTADLEAHDLQSTDATVTVSGLADMALRVSGTLDCSIGGEATICYHGDPTVTTNITGVGTVLPCE